MNPLIEAWMQMIGWTLVHFVWQGGLLAVVTGACLWSSRRRSAEARYAIACIGLTAMLAAPVVTAVVSWQPVEVAVPDGSRAPAASGSANGSLAALAANDDRSAAGSRAPALRSGIDDLLPLVVWAWLAGVTLLFARLVAGCWGVHRLRVASRAAPASSWQPAAERLAARLRVHVAFRVVETALVDGPSVIGLLRPVVLLPVAVVTALTPVQIEALLAHELAHIRRRDYAVNLLQTVAETLLFFHPAVWWVSSRIREEREHCCDDVAVGVSGEPIAYAAALAELASWRTRDELLSVGAADGQLLARVRRLLGARDADSPRAAGGLAVLAIGMTLVAGVAVRSMPQNPPAAGERATATAPPAATSQPAGAWVTRQTDHFEIYYTADLDLHAERVAREAERAYERVSADLRHNLAFKVPVFLFRTAAEVAQSAPAPSLSPMHAGSFAEPVGDRILLVTDRPADQWYGLLTHEVAHIFGFDILPRATTPVWISEGLAEYERGEWEPSDLAVLRGVVRSNAIPPLSRFTAADSGGDARLVYGLGHAAFEFIESRWGKPGLRQFLFALRQTAVRNSGDPFESAFQISAAEFDLEFGRYLRQLFAGAAAPPLQERFNYDATVRIEGDITAIRAPVAAGLACIELWVPAEGTTSQRWGIECGGESSTDVVRALRPGDRIIVTGAPARERAAQRLVVRSLERPSDGLTWRAQSR